MGDSRAVLSRHGQAVDLTEDHKPNCRQSSSASSAWAGSVQWHGFYDNFGKPVEGTGVYVSRESGVVSRERGVAFPSLSLSSESRQRGVAGPPLSLSLSLAPILRFPQNALCRSRSHSRYRINGNLAVARSIGDKFERPCVTDEVEIRTLPLDPEGDQFIVVATDGLWDVMSSAEAVEFVHARMSSTGVSDVNTLEVARGRRRGNSGGTTDASGAAAGDDRPKSSSDDRSIIKTAMQRRKRQMARFLTEEAPASRHNRQRARHLPWPRSLASRGCAEGQAASLSNTGPSCAIG